MVQPVRQSGRRAAAFGTWPQRPETGAIRTPYWSNIVPIDDPVGRGVDSGTA
jgi:hypothetical protein